MSSRQYRKLIPGEELSGHYEIGTVAGSKTWSETTVSSNTTVNGNGGYGYQTATTSTSSTSTEVNRFFLKRNDGKETELTIYGGGFSVRDGHVVSVVRVGPASGEWGYNIYYINHTTGQTKKAFKNINSIMEEKSGCLPFVLFIFLYIPASAAILFSSIYNYGHIVAAFVLAGAVLLGIFILISIFVSLSSHGKKKRKSIDDINSISSKISEDAELSSKSYGQ